MSTPSKSKAFELADVLADEATFIEARRSAVGYAGSTWTIPKEVEKKLDEDGSLAEKKNFQLGLVGLAFSGGGIRSATFNLGVLQALAELRLLRMFDYLSTISGGGYIGAWLAAWIHRDGDIGNVEKFLTPNRRVQSEAIDSGVGKDEHELAEPEPIRHLRSYSSYLAPRAGLFTADSWALIAVYLRNLLLNQLVLFPLSVAVVLLVLSLALRAHPTTKAIPIEPGMPVLVFGLAVGAAVIIYQGLLECRRGRWSAACATPTSTRDATIGAFQIGMAVVGLIIVGLVLASWPTFERDARNTWYSFAENRNLTWLGDLAKFDRHERNEPLTVEQSLHEEQAFHVVSFGVFIALGALVQSLSGNWASWCRLIHIPLLGWMPYPRPWRNWLFARLDFDPDQPLSATVCRALTFTVSGLMAGAGLGGLLYCLSHLNVWLATAYPLVGVTVVPPLFVLSIFVAACLQVGVLGNQEDEGIREWWGAFTARLFMGAIAWTIVFTLIVLVPGWLARTLSWEIKWTAVLGWLGATLSSVMIAKSEKTNGKRPAGWRDVVVMVGPFVFLAGWLVAISLIVRCVLTWWLGAGADASFAALSKVVDHRWMLCASVFSLVLSVFTGLWFVDVNLWSLHGMYTNRLARCYLGASRQKCDADRRGARIRTNETEVERVTNALTGFAADDDLDLAALGKAPDLHYGPFQKKDLRYTGPLHLFGGTLNLVSGEDLAWQERMADSFVFSPIACGSESTKYRPTKSEGNAAGYAANLKLGSVMAISGAAVSPSMGFYSSPAVTALLTAFNLRLGAWFGNPGKNSWQSSGPRNGWMQLLREMLGLTTDKSEYVYLSDGGHFDNLGVYELVRRRCRYIVCVDAGADSAHSCKELGDVIRNVRIDFGIRIEIDIDRLKLTQDRTTCGHVAVGRIRYTDRFVDTTPFGSYQQEGTSANDDNLDGYIFYIKPSFTGDEDPDLANFRDRHPDFPHETTIDQFFSESQFESYRSLGYHVARNVFRDVVLEEGERTDHESCAKECGRTEPHCEYAAKKTVGRCEQPWRAPHRVFKALHNRFEPNPSNEYIEQYLSLNEEYIAIQKALRDNPQLSALAKDLHDESVRNLLAENKKRGIEDTPGSEAMSTYSWRAERHLLLEMLTVAENAFLGLGLGQRQFESSNSGWVRVVNLWISTSTFARNWETIKYEFSPEFRRYVERHKPSPDARK